MQSRGFLTILLFKYIVEGFLIFDDWFVSKFCYLLLKAGSLFSTRVHSLIRQPSVRGMLIVGGGT